MAEPIHGKAFRESLLTDWRQAMTGNPSMLFFQTENPGLFGLFLKPLEARIIEDGGIYLYQDVVPAPVTGPYEPFITWLRTFITRLSDREIKSLFRKAGIYEYQQAAFLKLVLNRGPGRTEPVIFEDIHYESRRFIEGMTNLLLAQTEDFPIFMAINNMQYMKPSALNILRHLLTVNRGRILITGAVNQSSSHNPDYVSDEWNEVILALQNRGGLLELDTEQDKTGQALPPAPSAVKPRSPAEYAESLLGCLALQECRDFCQDFLNMAWPEWGPNGYNDQCSIQITLIEALNLLDETDSALVQATQLLNLAHSQKDAIIIAEASLLCGLLYYRRNEFDQAIRYVHRAWLLIREYRRGTLLTRAYFYLFLIRDTIGRISDEYMEAYDSIWDRMINGFEGLGWTNHLSYVKSRGIYIFFLTRKQEKKLAARLCESAISIAEKSGNQFRLSIAYHTLGMLYQAVGEYSKAISAYRKSHRIIGRMGDPIENARISNGIGYYYFSLGLFNKAQYYYTSALEWQSRSRNYEEIGNSLCNLGSLYFFTFHYDEAIYYLENVLKLLDYLHIQELTYHPRFNIYSMLGICYLRKGQYSRALDCVNRVNRQPGLQNELHLFEYVELLKALVALARQDKSRADRSFEKSIDVLATQIKDTRHIALLCVFEYGRSLAAQGLTEKSQFIFNKGLEFCGSEPYHPFLRRIFKAGPAAYAQNLPAPLIKIRRRSFSTELLLDFARQDFRISRLHRKINEINFLNTIQNLISGSETQKELLEKTVDFIQGSHPVDETAILLYELGDKGRVGGWRLEYLSPADTDTTGLKALATSIYTRYGREEVLIHDAAEIEHAAGIKPRYLSLIYVPLMVEDTVIGCIICGKYGRSLKLSRDDLRVFTIAAGQIALALKLKGTAQELLRAATIDSLTGLLNRQELFSRMEEASRQAARYPGTSVFSLLFIDLDHFKYYNDTFGHQAGDVLLQEFAAILRSTLREVDIPGRYGGDEFLVLLPQTDNQTAYRVAERIRENLAAKKGFVRIMEEILSRRVEIDMAKWLSCSIGVTEFNPECSTIDDLVSRADALLYQAKRAGRNRSYSSSTCNTEK